MAAASFQLFSNLPVEIQRLVWDVACRPITGQRQVQFFIIADNFAPKGWHSARGDFLRLGSEGRVNQGFKLAVPRKDAIPGGNNSAYLADSGLWMACLESRAAMERQYRQNEWWSEMPGATHPARLAGPGEQFKRKRSSHTASYTDSQDAQVKHITFRPVDDLVCFAPLMLDDVDWFHHYAHDEIPLVDRYDEPRRGRCFLGPNVALVYDPIMMPDSSRINKMCAHTWSGVAQTFLVDFVALFHEDMLWTIWFIDYRLRRRGQPKVTEPPRPDARQAFYSSNCIFTEVRKEDSTHWDIQGKDQGSVFDMLAALDQQANGQLEIDNSDRIRVLACEAQPGKCLSPWPTPLPNEPCDACAAAQVPTRRGKGGGEFTLPSEDDEVVDLENFSLFD